RRVLMNRLRSFRVFYLTALIILASCFAAIFGYAYQTPQKIAASKSGSSSTVSLGLLYVLPNPVTGGTTATAHITLSSPAPAGGVIISLYSSSSMARVPQTVTIYQNATSASFSVRTKIPSVPTNVTLFAFYGGLRTTAVLTVLPQPTAVTLSSVTVNPTGVSGGNSSQGTVNLSGA